MTNLNLFRIFKIVAEEKNLTRASERLFISQPAVSQAMKELEKELGGTLFERKNKGIELTNEGSAIFEKITPAMEEFETAENYFNLVKEMKEGKIRIGTNTSNLNRYLYDSIKAFANEYPRIKIQILWFEKETLLEKLNNGELDYAVISSSEIPENCELIKSIVIYYEVMGSKKYHDKYKDSPLTLDDFSNEDLLLSNKRYASREDIDDFFSLQGITLKPKYELEGYTLVSEFAKNGSGLTILNPFYYRNELEKNELYLIPKKFALPPKTISVLKPKIKSKNVSAIKYEKYLKIDY